MPELQGRPPAATAPGRGIADQVSGFIRTPVRGVNTHPPRVLAVAGSDSSGGAGIQADLKTIAMLGGYGMTAITALTAQNTLGVQAVRAMDGDFVRSQMASCLDDIGVDAIKTGMLPDADVVRAVAVELGADDCGRRKPLVVDPVLVATSGDTLAGDDVIEALHDALFPLATVVTPNLPELAALTGTTCDTREDAIAAAKALQARHGCFVLAKGGHPTADGEEHRVVDRLVGPDGYYRSFDHPRIETGETHGTGCTTASAIATFLGRGMDVPDAVEAARQFVRLAIHDAPGFGEGRGPLGHERVRLDFPIGPTLNQATLPARDFGEAVDFYTRLGLRPIVISPNNGYARFECVGGSTLSIATGHGDIGGAALYFEVPDLEIACELAAAANIELEPIAAQGWNWREAWGSDPSGNRFCLYEAKQDRRYPPWRVD